MLHKRPTFRRAALLCCFLLAAALALACPLPARAAMSDPPVADTLSAPASLALQSGQVVDFGAEVAISPSGLAVEGRVRLSSSDPSVVSTEGLTVVARGAGTATLTARYLTLRAQCAVTVTEAPRLLALPRDTQSVAADAFRGADFQKIVLPDGCETVGAGAFAGMEDLALVMVPDSVTSIGAGAFSGCPGAWLCVGETSYARRYAVDNNLAYRLRAAPVTPAATYPAGTYAVGTNIPAGEYLLLATNGGGRCAVYADATQAQAVVDLAFSTNLIVTVNAGESLRLTGCTAVSYAQSDWIPDFAQTGMTLKVGGEIAAGEYKLVCEGATAGAYAVYSSSRLTDDALVRQSVVTDVLSVTLTEGQYLRYDGCTLRAATYTPTTYRAFAVGVSYAGTEDELNGTIHDREAICAMLDGMTATPYTVTYADNPTTSGIISGIRTAFAGADDNDVSLFYYSGHGASGGYLIGRDISFLPPAQLRTVLDGVKGKKIVIVDACHSGAIVGQSVEGAALQAVTESFTDGFTAAFADDASLAGTNDLADNGYYVLVACRGSQTSLELSLSGGNVSFGAFTYALTSGCGWNEIYDYQLDNLNADADGNGLLSLKECFDWTKSAIAELKQTLTSLVQITTCYPANSAQVLFGRAQE